MITYLDREQMIYPRTDTIKIQFNEPMGFIGLVIGMWVRGHL